MSSIWSLMCFPRGRSGGKNRHRNRRRNKGNEVTLQKRKLLDDRGQVQETLHFNTDQEYRQPDLTPKQTISNKRRRVQDIFNLNQHDNQDESSHQDHSDFTHMKVPSLFGNRNKPKSRDSDNIESMYGYVPKAMQSLYTSTALEGQKIEDYFTNLHNDVYFTKFANSETSCKDKSESIFRKLSFTRVPSSASSVKDDKVSLMDEDSINEMDIVPFSDSLHFGDNLSPHIGYDIEESFHSMLNSTEEVLY